MKISRISNSKTYKGFKTNTIKLEISNKNKEKTHTNTWKFYKLSQTPHRSKRRIKTTTENHLENKE